MSYHSDPGHSSSPTRPAGPKQGLVIQLASSLTIMGSVMIAPVLPKIGAAFGPTTPYAHTLVPLVATAPALAITVFAPISGWLADRFGRKLMLILATIFYALFGVLPPLLHSLPMILGSRLLFGCCEATIMTCCSTLIADYWRGEDRARYINRQVITIGLVGAIFFVVGGAVGEHSWKLPFALYALPLLLLPWIFTLLWEPKPRGEEEKEEDATAQAAETTSSSIAATLLAAYALIFIGMVASFVVPIQAPTFLVAIGVSSSTLIGLCTGLGLLATLAGAICWIPARNRLNVAGVNVLLLLLMAAGLGLLTVAHSYAVVLLAVSIHGFGAGFLVPNAQLPLLTRLPPRLRARGVGGLVACLYFGQFISPIVVEGLQHFGAAIIGRIPPGPAPALGVQIWAAWLVIYALLWLLPALHQKRHFDTAESRPTPS